MKIVQFPDKKNKVMYVAYAERVTTLDYADVDDVVNEWLVRLVDGQCNLIGHSVNCQLDGETPLDVIKESVKLILAKDRPAPLERVFGVNIFGRKTMRRKRR